MLAGRKLAQVGKTYVQRIDHAPFGPGSGANDHIRLAEKPFLRNRADVMAVLFEREFELPRQILIQFDFHTAADTFQTFSRASSAA